VDIMMPRLDGYQTCALIKKNPRLSPTPVIMLSSRDGLFDRARGRMAGSDEYLTKPFTKDSLLRAVASHARRGGGAAHAPLLSHAGDDRCRSERFSWSTTRPSNASPCRKC
jgi:twitching motility two-component system response regulator PilG